jgi:Ribosome biogenesis regulatory protein (RRS1)
MVAATKSQRSVKQGLHHREKTDTRAADSEEEIESEEDDLSEGTEEQSSEEESDEGAEHNGDDSASGSNEEEDENGDDDDDDDDDEQEQSNARMESQLFSSGEQCTFDLRNLVAVSSHQLNASLLYSSKRPARESDITISLEDSRIQVDEEQLLEKARDGCAQLISAIWQLPKETSDAGPLVTLPSYFEIKIPRALVSYGRLSLGNTLWTEIY